MVLYKFNLLEGRLFAILNSVIFFLISRILKIIFIYLQHWAFIAARELSLAVAGGGYSLIATHGLLIAVASLLVERGL